MSDVKQFAKSKSTEKPHAGELFERIKSLVYEYDGELGTAEAMGVLEMVKLSIYIDAHDDQP
jgi:hypothetical protein